MSTKVALLSLLSVSTMAMALPAKAANYIFDVNYTGNNVATLAPGSANPLTTNLMAGDTFTYRLTAISGEWTTLPGAGHLFFELMNSSGWGSFNLTYTLNLNQNSANVFTTSGNVSSCCAHLGPTTISVGAGITFDQYELFGTINSIQNPGAATTLLPWNGLGPENNTNGKVTYAPVPEPATWAMMLLGFGGIGAAMRRTRANVRLAQIA